jgi:hypothetical protein
LLHARRMMRLLACVALFGCAADDPVADSLASDEQAICQVDHDLLFIGDAPVVSHAYTLGRLDLAFQPDLLAADAFDATATSCMAAARFVANGATMTAELHVTLRGHDFELDHIVVHTPDGDATLPRVEITR